MEAIEIMQRLTRWGNSTGLRLPASGMEATAPRSRNCAPANSSSMTPWRGADLDGDGVGPVDVGIDMASVAGATSIGNSTAGVTLPAARTCSLKTQPAPTVLRDRAQTHPGFGAADGGAHASVSLEELFGEGQQAGRSKCGPVPKWQLQIEAISLLPKARQRFVSQMLEIQLLSRSWSPHPRSRNRIH
jgi:hypothetical protein